MESEIIHLVGCLRVSRGFRNQRNTFLIPIRQPEKQHPLRVNSSFFSMNSLVLALSALFYGFCQAQFQVLDADATAISTAVTLSDACLDALQGTVNCNSSLVNIAAADSFYGIDNETYVFLCNDGCSSSLESYHSSVSSACAGQDEAWSGYPATYFGDVYWATYNLSCLAEPTSGSSCMGKILLAIWPTILPH